MRNDCVFCGIFDGEVEHSLVHEDERVVAFMDIRPVVRGHVLVAPRSHSAHLVDLDPDDGAAIFELGRRVAAALRGSGLRCEGVNFFVADGEAAGQDVFHVHLHVIPRYEGDGFGLQLPPEYSIRPREELNDAAQSIRGAWS